MFGRFLKLESRKISPLCLTKSSLYSVSKSAHHYVYSSSFAAHPSDALLEFELSEAALDATVVFAPLGIHRATFSSSVMECRFEGSSGISDDGFFLCNNFILRVRW